MESGEIFSGQTFLHHVFKHDMSRRLDDSHSSTAIRKTSCLRYGGDAHQTNVSNNCFLFIELR